MGFWQIAFIHEWFNDGVHGPDHDYDRGAHVLCGRVRDVGVDRVRGAHALAHHGHSLHDSNFYVDVDDPYVLRAIHRKFSYNLPSFQNYLRFYYIRRKLMIHIRPLNDCDTSAELQQNSQLCLLAIYILAGRMGDYHLFEKKLRILNTHTY